MPTLSMPAVPSSAALDRGPGPDAVILVPAPLSRPALVGVLGDAPDPGEPPALQPVLPVMTEDGRETVDEGVPPQAARAAQALGRALAEVLSGSRPVSQIRPALLPRVAHLLDHLIRSGAGFGSRLASMRLQCPHPDAVEVCLVLAGPRGGAVALRVEHYIRRWAVTTVEAALGPDARRPART